MPQSGLDRIDEIERRCLPNRRVDFFMARCICICTTYVGGTIVLYKGSRTFVVANEKSREMSKSNGVPKLFLPKCGLEIDRGLFYPIIRVISSYLFRSIRQIALIILPKILRCSDLS